MTRKRKIIIWIFSVILLITIIIIAFGERMANYYFDKKFHPREPKNEFEVTYNLGWWSYQESMRIDSFKVELIDSRLNLFNSFSLIRYTIYGQLSKSDNWRPYVDKVHISERFIRKFDRELHTYLDIDTVNTPEAIIEITPIVNVKDDSGYKGEKIPFEITNELKIGSFHWGNNWLRLQCDTIKRDVILRQRK